MGEKYKKDNIIQELAEENGDQNIINLESEGFVKFNYNNGKIHGDYEGRFKTVGKKVNLLFKLSNSYLMELEKLG